MAADSSPVDGAASIPAAGYRLVILGGDPAGTVAAREAAQRGIRVAVLKGRGPQFGPPLLWKDVEVSLHGHHQTPFRLTEGLLNDLFF